MYNIDEHDINAIVYHFSRWFEYDYDKFSYTAQEGKCLDIKFYNSPIRRSFIVNISYDENTYLDQIIDAIINAYIKRLD